MKNMLAGVTIALMTFSSVPHAQDAPADNGLGDLAAMTFGCPKAALNAAAREAAKIPSQGTYQFSYFKIINDSHHAAYEVHFKSNYRGEKELKYCVAIYCQQGWDPKTTRTTVTWMNDPRQPRAANCGVHPKGAATQASPEHP
jgi:DNA/RNA endonuclease G (NUC1)